jgi:hypothetical protein
MNENKTGTPPARDEVAQKAYARHVKEGRPQGHEVRNWLDAEAQIDQTPPPATARCRRGTVWSRQYFRGYSLHPFAVRPESSRSILRWLR